MIIKLPSLLGYDTNSDGPTSIKGKVEFYRTYLKLSDNEIKNMIIKSPSLLGLDTNTDGPKSVKTKLNKLKTFIEPNRLIELIKNDPNFLCVPAQKFKIRYMLATDLNFSDIFNNCKLITGEATVWARFCFLNENGIDKYYNVFVSKKVFKRIYGADTDYLVEKYPLDKEAIKFIEETYMQKTGHKLTLDESELSALGF